MKTNFLYQTQKPWILNVIPIAQMIIGILGLVIAVFANGVLQILGIGFIYLFGKGLFKLLKNLNTKIYLKSQQLTIETGVLAKEIIDISINKFEGISISQGFIGRLFNFGFMQVSTGGVSCSYYIKNPKELRTQIINQLK